MEESTILYFISRLDSIRIIFIISAILSGFFCLVCLLLCSDDYDHLPKSVLWLVIIIFLGSVMLCIFVPDTEEGLALYRETYQIPLKEK